MTSPKIFERLPSDPSPIHYDLTYSWVSLEGTTEFEGKVEVLVEFGKSFETANKTTVKLNSLNLDIASAKLDQRDTSCISIFAKQQLVVLEFEGPTMDGKTTLVINFRGRLSEQLSGFYKSKLSDNLIMGVTQFEATDARRAFPCWDEPARKATFRLKMTVSPEAMVYSNTRPKRKTFVQTTWPSGKIKEGIEWEFYPTPKMSTYLLAWAVTPTASLFDQVSACSTVPPFTETIVYVPKGKAKQAEFALNIGVKALEFFADIFDMEYPLPLLQHFACADFSAGAMENFGFITYREARLLINPETSTSSSKRDVARVVCHEIAHQWFGNTCTMGR